jgi:hypothetical protein
MQKVLTCVVALLIAFFPIGNVESQAELSAGALYSQIEEKMPGTQEEENSTQERESYEKAILFLGMQWGCSIDEAVTHLNDIGFTSSYIQDNQDVHCIDNRILIDESAFTCTSSSSDWPDDFFVLGHLVSKVNAYAIYGIVDGKISRETADSRLYKGAYCLEASTDVDDLFNDLYSKRKSRYGDPQEYKNSQYAKSVIWYGQNNTATTLSIDRSDVDSVIIEYWDLDVYGMIKEMENIRFDGDKTS